MILIDLNRHASAGELSHQLGEQLAGQHHPSGFLHVRCQDAFNAQAAVGAGQVDPFAARVDQHPFQNLLGGSWRQCAGHGIQAVQQVLSVHGELHGIILSWYIVHIYYISQS